MPFLRKFLCFSLRDGCLYLCYVNLITQLFDVLWIVYTNYQFCQRVYVIWFFSTLWHVISELILIYAVFGQNYHLMPLHMVTNLLGLILQMINHMMIAALPHMKYVWIGYSLYEIA
ncbi:hypothetical protein KR074_001971, partial [Drosophila pseudoananassae]